MSSNPNHYRVETLNGRTGLCMAVWLQVKVHGRKLSLQPIGRTPALCVTKVSLQLRYAACGAILSVIWFFFNLIG